jgi:GNAT superfamily N-acetyltransferase
MASMSDTEFELRLWLPTDSAEELTDLLHRAYVQLGEMGLNYTAVDQSVERTLRDVTQDTCIVAVAASQLVGTILVRGPQPSWNCDWYRRPTTASACRFAVSPERQSRGLGSRLLQEAEIWAREQKFGELAVDTAEQATHLIGFYTRRGYRFIETVQWPGKTYRSVVLSKSL